MSPIDSSFRERARDWADRPPRRIAAEAAAAARAAGARRGAGRTPRLPLAALGAAAVAAALLLGRPAPAPVRSAPPPGPAPRQIVLELSSGTRVYVDLTPPATSRRPS